MAKSFKNVSWKNVLTVGVSILLIVGTVAGCFALFGKPSKTVDAGDFVRGSLSETDGSFLNTKKSIVTEDLFDCKGLQVKIDFTTTSNYQVFWYNEDGLYLGATDIIESGNSLPDGVPGAAVKARVVVYPIVRDENGRIDKDFEIEWFEVRKYAKTVNISVATNQVKLRQNLFAELPHHVYGEDELAKKFNALQTNNNIWIDGVSVSDAKNVLKVESGIANSTSNMLKLDASNVAVYKLDLSKSNKNVSLYMYDADGTYMNRVVYSSGLVHFVDLSESTQTAIFCVLLVAEDYDSAVLSEYLYRSPIAPQ